MTDFTFARVGLRNYCFLLPKEPGKKNNKTGFDNIKTGKEDLQRCENLTLFADLKELFKTIRLIPVNPFPEFTLGFNTSVHQNCNTLLFKTPNSIHLTEFSFQRSAIDVPHLF